MFDVKNAIDKTAPYVAEWRHQIHENPELSFEEHKTAALVQTVLKNAGIEVVRYPNSTAVVGILTGGKPGKTIALRADMDALPLQEEAEVEFESQVPGVMHACGHDMHTAILLGVATILAEHREDVPGIVKFLFQPAEECPPGGAKPMVEAGALENPDVDHAFGLHVSPAYPAGEIGLKYGYSSANTDMATIKIIGKGGHGAHPDKTSDAVVIASHVVVALQTIVSRNLSAVDSGVITIGSIHGGTVNNIIAETVELKLTIRSLTQETRQLLRTRIEEIVQGVTQSMHATYEIDYLFGYPAVHNADEAVEIVKSVAEKTVGEDKINWGKVPSMGGEDFSYFAQKVPSSFFGLGAMPENRDEMYPGHNPRYKISEKCIPVGLEMMVNIVMEASKE